MALWNNRRLAKALLSLVFAVSAHSQAREHKLVQQQIWTKIESLGWRSDGMPPLLLAASVALQSAGVVALLLGRDRLGAMILLLFLLPTTFLMHNPVQPHPTSGVPTLDPERLTHCLKNLAIMGGLMLLGRGEAGNADDVQAPGGAGDDGLGRAGLTASSVGNARGGGGWGGVPTQSKQKPL